MSEYHVASTDKPDELAKVLSHALGEKGMNQQELHFETKDVHGFKKERCETCFSFIVMKKKHQLQIFITS